MKNYLQILLMLISIVACSEIEESEQLEKNKESTEIVCKNGMLVFPDSQKLGEVLANNENVAISPFFSQKDIYNNLIDEEYNYASSLKNLSDEEYALSPKHTEMYTNLLDEGFIKEQKYTDGSVLYSLNLCAPNYSKVLNKEGFFAVKDTIFQVTADRIKMWVGGDVYKCDFLNQINQTDEVKNVYVFNNENPNVPTKSIPILKNVANQEIAYYKDENPYGQSFERVVMTFIDKVLLNLPEGYIRNSYIRISMLEKVDGRNFIFAQKQYNYNCLFQPLDESYENISFGSSVIGADNWYTVYYMYGFVNEGQQTQVITEASDYYPIQYFAITVDKRTKPIIYTYFHGTRDGNIFMYGSGDIDTFRYSGTLPE